MREFVWTREPGRTGAQVEYLLRQYGIRCYRRQMDNPDLLGLSVSDRQANWAEYLLLSAGVPLVAGAVDGRNQGYAERRGGSMPTPWGAPVRAGDFVGRIVDIIDGLFGHAHRRQAQRFVRERARRRR